TEPDSRQSAALGRLEELQFRRPVCAVVPVVRLESEPRPNRGELPATGGVVAEEAAAEESAEQSALAVAARGPRRSARGSRRSADETPRSPRPRGVRRAIALADRPGGDG